MSTTSSPAGSDADLAAMSLAEAARSISDREVSAVDYARRMLERIARHAELSAFITVSADLLLADAERADARVEAGDQPLGPLHGVPIAIKDNIDTVDLPTTGGTPSLRESRPGTDADVVRALRQAGALVIGKTNLHELAYGVTSVNGFFGSVRNPYDHDRIAGGSSGGTAAAVSARLAPAGLGTDTGGSVRIPAALCGVVGLRPTGGRYPQQGIMLVSTTRDTAGPLARTVSDVALLDAVLTGAADTVPREIDLRGRRLGVVRAEFFGGLAPDLAELIEQRLAQLADHGAQLVDVRLPDNAAELIVDAGFPIAFYETPIALRDYLATVPGAPGLIEVVNQCGSSDVKQILTMILGEGRISAERYREALTVHRPALEQVFRSALADNGLTAFIGPTTPLTAVLASVDTVTLGGADLATFDAYTRTTGPFSGIGWPGLTVPAGLDSRGLPFGLALDGPPGSDATLLGIGQACERIFGQLPGPLD
jgi:Asp-tRNA(Asn)/Glu-tRNA(Gln) amidotransferase A subunit family amidase